MKNINKKGAVIFLIITSTLEMIFFALATTVQFIPFAVCMFLTMLIQNKVLKPYISKNKNYANNKLDEAIKELKELSKEKDEKVKTIEDKNIIINNLNDEVQEHLFNEKYSIGEKNVRIPFFNVSRKNLDTLFYTTYKHFKKKGLEDYYKDVMSKYLNYTFAKSVQDNYEEISVEDLIDNLESLKFFGFTEEEINSLQDDVQSRTCPVIISFDTAKRKIKIEK